MRKLKKFLAELLIACMVFTSVPFTAFAEGTGEVVFVNKGEKLDRKCSYKLSCKEGVKVATGSQVSLTIEENPGWVLAATPSMRKRPGGADVGQDPLLTLVSLIFLLVFALKAGLLLFFWTERVWILVRVRLLHTIMEY